MIVVRGRVVEIDGDEMSRAMWAWVRDGLILPHVDVDREYFDLSIENREATGDQVTLDAAEAIAAAQVGVKCATITPDRVRMDEYGLSKLWPSPNGTIRSALDGVIFREPVILPTVPRTVPTWYLPIIIGRHAHGDQYKSTGFTVQGPGTLTMRFTPEDGSHPVEHHVATFPEHGGVGLGMYNFTDSIESFARACLNYGLQRGYPVYLSTKNTILKEYDGAFKDIFERIYEREFRHRYETRGLTYEHRLIDDMVAFALKSHGGFIWACKNYDGDVQSDSVAQGFGSPGLMTSVLTSPDGGTVLTEAAHGTVARHYRRHRAGDEVSTNPIATIHAWTRALAHRAHLDGHSELMQFTESLNYSVASTVAKGVMTRDLAMLVGDGQPHVSTAAFVDAVAENFRSSLPPTGVTNLRTHPSELRTR